MAETKDTVQVTLTRDEADALIEDWHARGPGTIPLAKPAILKLRTALQSGKEQGQ